MEVSCKNTKAIFYGLEHYTDVPIDRLVEGLPVTLEYLNNPKNKIDWAVYSQILERITDYCPTEDDLVQLGFDIVLGPNKHNRARKLIGLAISPNQLYKIVWLWVARSEWPHCHFTYEELARDQVYLTWQIDETEPMSMALHHITNGLLKGYPTLICLPPAEVKFEGTLHKGCYTITSAPSLTLWARLRRVLHLFRPAQNAIDELAEQQLQIVEAEKKFRAIAETAVDSIVMVDSEMKIRYWNDGAEKAFGYQSMEVMGKRHSLIMPERFRPEAEQGLSNAVANDRGSLRGQPAERIGLRKDGTEFPIEIAVSSWKTDEGVLFTAIIRDITPRKLVEEKLRQSEERYRALAQRLMTMQDDERERVSRDLHDSIGQYLATMSLHTSILKKKISGKSVTDELEDMNKILKEAMDECHRIAFELSPPLLKRAGLEMALREMISSSKDRGLEIELQSNLNDERLPEAVEVSIIRLVQEAINNVRKHARASRVTLKLNRIDGRIELSIEDDGIGFDPNNLVDNGHASVKSGLGLMSMRERTELTGGVFNIESSPGDGTSISVTFPVKSVK